MKNLIFTLGLFIMMTACGNNAAENNSDTVENEYPIQSIKELALSDSLIDVDLLDVQASGIMSKESTRGTISEIPREVRAALYRFYSHVSLEDSLYVCNLKSAGEINVSEKLFNDMMNDLQKCNMTIKENNEKGLENVLSPVDSTYLSSLLME